VQTFRSLRNASERAENLRTYDAVARPRQSRFETPIETFRPHMHPSRSQPAPRSPQNPRVPEARADVCPLNALTRSVARTIGVSVAVLCQHDGGAWRVRAGTEPSGAGCGGLPVSEAFLDEVSQGAVPMRVEDVRSDLRLRREPGTERELRSLLATPVAGGEGAAVLLAIGAEPRSWSESEVAALADAVVIAAELLEREVLEVRVRDTAAALASSREQYRRLTDSAHMVIYSVDAEGVITELNHAGRALLDAPGVPALGRHFTDFIAPEDVEGIRARLASGDVSGQAEFHVVLPGGERRLLQVHSVGVLEQGERCGRMGIARDITEERAREMHFRRAERMASVAPLLSGVCHELNNPLTSIKSFAELLLLDEREPDDREALEIVQREAARAAQIVSDLRVVARQGKAGAVQRAAVRLNEVVRQVIEMRGVDLDAGGVRLELCLDAGLAPVWAVRSQLQEVLDQLIKNAILAMQAVESPVLTITTRSAHGSAMLVVQDCGCGIPEEQLDRIFDPFWTTRGPEGTGLGLSIVHGIVTDHGGTVRVESREEHGTWVTVAIPVLEREPVAHGEAHAETATATPLRILIADDEAAIRFSLTRYMERRGHRVEQASDGVEALARIDQAAGDGGFHIVVADLRMPGLAGHELWEILARRSDRLAERLIFISGDTHLPEAEATLLEAGVPMVQKPFELAEIAQIIESHAQVAGM
jgi:two-component system, NtrC family, sensor kinase